MKIKNMKWVALMALAVAGMGLTSCEDQPDKYKITSGTPSISFIRPVDVAKKDSLLTAASLSNTIVLVGHNLRSITSLLFNDVPAVLNTSYITDNTMIVTVPKTLPTHVSDQIYMVTGKHDTIPYPFKVTIPAPDILGMSNEHAKAGESVTIMGDYFLDYDNAPLQVKVGDGYTIDRRAITSLTKTAITFTVPENMPHDFIHVVSKYGDTKASFKYMDNRGLLFNFDTPWDGTNVLGNHGWHNQKIQEDDASLEGHYLMLGDADLAKDAAWNDGNFCFEYWAGTWDKTFDKDGPKLNDVADFSNWNKKALKFEMCIPSDHPWTSGAMQLIFAGIDKVTLFNANNTFFHHKGDISRALYMPWNNSDKSYDTGGKWVTVTIPFTDFNRDWDGNALNSTFRSVEDFASLTIFVVKGGYDDKSVIPDGKDGHPVIRIDNIRVVPMN